MGLMSSANKEKEAKRAAFKNAVFSQSVQSARPLGTSSAFSQSSQFSTLTHSKFQRDAALGSKRKY